MHPVRPERHAVGGPCRCPPQRCFKLNRPAFDARFVTDLPIWLEEEGLEVVEVLQGFALSEAIVAFIGMIKDVELKHGGNPVMRWAAQNLRVRLSEEGRYKAVKKSQRKRIDPLVATFSAVNRAIANREDYTDILAGAVAV